MATLRIHSVDSPASLKGINNAHTHTHVPSLCVCVCVYNMIKHIFQLAGKEAGKMEKTPALKPIVAAVEGGLVRYAIKTDCNLRKWKWPHLVAGSVPVSVRPVAHATHTHTRNVACKTTNQTIENVAIRKNERSVRDTLHPTDLAGSGRHGALALCNISSNVSTVRAKRLIFSD